MTKLPSLTLVSLFARTSAKVFGLLKLVCSKFLNSSHLGLLPTEALPVAIGSVPRLAPDAADWHNYILKVFLTDC
ncbi:hypothetical protein [Scytonema sp. PCC 10023]|uniref:hypothetical protein n=1 Tax=Scytonema sp. PCC 10023 TaxID=1680591 RepID=UPI0039C6570A